MWWCLLILNILNCLNFWKITPCNVIIIIDIVILKRNGANNVIAGVVSRLQSDCIFKILKLKIESLTAKKFSTWYTFHISQSTFLHSLILSPTFPLPPSSPSTPMHSLTPSLTFSNPKTQNSKLHFINLTSTHPINSIPPTFHHQQQRYPFHSNLHQHTHTKQITSYLAFIFPHTSLKFQKPKFKNSKSKNVKSKNTNFKLQTTVHYSPSFMLCHLLPQAALTTLNNNKKTMHNNVHG